MYFCSLLSLQNIGYLWKGIKPIPRLNIESILPRRTSPLTFDHDIPGSTTDPLIMPPFNQVYLNHKLLTCTCRYWSGFWAYLHWVPTPFSLAEIFCRYFRYIDKIVFSDLRNVHSWFTCCMYFAICWFTGLLWLRVNRLLSLAWIGRPHLIESLKL